MRHPLVTAFIALLMLPGGFTPAGDFSQRDLFPATKDNTITVKTGTNQTWNCALSKRFPVDAGKLYSVTGKTSSQVNMAMQSNLYPVNAFICWYDAAGKCFQKSFLFNATRPHHGSRRETAVTAPANSRTAALLLGVSCPAAVTNFQEFQVREKTALVDTSMFAGVQLPAAPLPGTTPQGEVTAVSPTRAECLLNGVWNFLPVAADRQPSAKWQTIKVPRYWNGGKTNFNVPPEWEKAPYGVYYRDFTVPAEWAGKRVQLHFGAVSMHATVIVNGKTMGSHYGAFTPFAVDVTDAVKPGANRLQVNVVSAGIAGSFGGKHIISVAYDRKHGGIWQNVKLQALPQVAAIEPYVKTSFRKHSLQFSFVADHRGPVPFTGKVRCGVYEIDAPGTPVLAFAEMPVSFSAGRAKVELPAIPWEKPRLWCPEDPHLYYLRTDIVDANGQLVDRLQTRFGFREFWCEGSDFYLNGKIRRLHGDTAFPEDHGFGASRRDGITLMFKTLKDTLHINTMRFHALLPNPTCLEVADETGMLLDVQSGLVGGGNCGPRYISPDTKAILLENLRREFTEWVKRDRNHPSLLVWDMENEFFACTGDKESIEILEEVTKTILANDDTRMVSGAAAGDLDGRWPYYNYHNYDGYGARWICDYWAGKKDKPYVNEEFWAAAFPQYYWGDAIYKDFATAAEAYGKSMKNWIEYQRARGAAGLIPFYMSNYAFGNPFKGKVPVKWDNPAAPGPQMDYVGRNTIPMGNGDQFNAGWVKNAPACRPLPTAIKHLEYCFRPAHVMFKYLGHNYYRGTEFSNTAVIANDTREPLACTLRFTLRDREGKPLAEIPAAAYSLKAGELREIPVKFTVPPGEKSLPAVLHAYLEKDGRPLSDNTLELNLYAAADAKQQPAARIGILGDNGDTLKKLSALGFTPEKAGEDFSACALVVIAENADLETFLPRKKALWDYLRQGGKVLLLQQRESCSGLLPGGLASSASRLTFNHRYTSLLKNDAGKNFGKNRERAVLATDPGHPLWRGIISPRICHWRNADHTVDCGFFAKHRLCGNFRPLSYLGRECSSDATTLEYACGKGRYLATQLSLVANAGTDPEADIILANAVRYLLTATPLAPRQNAIVGAEAQKVLAVPGIAAARIANLQDVQPGQFANVFLSPRELTVAGAAALAQKTAAAGANVFAFFDSGSRQFVKDLGADLQACSYSTLYFPQGKPDYLCGLNGLDLKSEHNANYKHAVRLPQATAPEWHVSALAMSVQRFWEYPYENNPQGIFAAEKTVGRGRVILMPWRVLATPRERQSYLVQTLLTTAGTSIVPTETDVPSVRFIRCKGITMDGDLKEWTYDKTVEELIDYQHAEPIVLTADKVHVGGEKPAGRKDISAVAYFMYDARNLYFAAQVLDNQQQFAAAPGLLYQGDSLDFFIGDTQVQVSVINGKVAIEMQGELKSAGKPEAVIRPFTDAGRLKDMHLLADADTLKNAGGYIVEGKIPLDALFPNGQPPKRCRFSVGVNDCDKISAGRKTQLCFPKGWQWRKQDTFAEGVFAE